MKPLYQFPMVKLPFEMEQTLYLIREELKSRNFFNGLQQIGLDDCYFQPHLDTLILRCLEIDSSDENFSWYTDIIEKRSRKIEPDQQSITKQALKAYYEIMNEKKKREGDKEDK
jgi:hypothetical protein